jgi:hypothetical protein
VIGLGFIRKATANTHHIPTLSSECGARNSRIAAKRTGRTQNRYAATWLIGSEVRPPGPIIERASRAALPDRHTIKVIENCYGSYIIIKPMLVTKLLRTFNKRHFAYLFVILTLTAIDAFARPIKTPPPPPPPPPVVPALLAMISGLSSLVLP